MHFIPLILLVLVAISPTAYADPCRQLAQYLSTGNVYVDYNSVRSCYLSFPYSRDVAKSTIDKMAKLLSLYVFLDYAVNPAAMSHQKSFKLRNLINSFTSTPFPNDWTLHDSISRNLIHVNDGHLEYEVSCYNQFAFLQPFFIVAVMDKSGKTRIVVHSVDGQHPFPPQLNLAQFQGAEIVSLDGQPVQRALHEYARDFIGKSKGLRTRFIKALAFRYWDPKAKAFKNDRGWFSRRFRLPDRDAVVYGIRLVNGQVVTVRVPWVIAKVGEPRKFTNQQEYYAAFCQYEPSKVIPEHVMNGFEKAHRKIKNLIIGKRSLTGTEPQAVEGGQQEPQEGEQNQQGEGPQEQTQPQLQQQPQMQAPRPPPGADPQPFAVGPGFAFFQLANHPKIAVLVIVTFSNPVKKWSKALYEGFIKFQQRGMDHLLLDLSNNGGGNICQANMLLSIIDPNPKGIFPVPHHPYETAIRFGGILSRLENIAKKHKDLKTPFRIARFVRTSFPFTNFSFDSFKHKIRLIRGGESRLAKHRGTYFTRRLMDKCTSNNNPLAQLKVRFSKVAVLTNGYCASSCAIVAGNLQEMKLAKTIVTVVGSYPSPPLYSFAGGQLLTSEDVFDFMRKYKVNASPEIPATFPRKAILRMTFRQIYSIRQRKIPLEYYRQPADIKLAVSSTNVMSPETSWLDAAQELAWINPTQRPPPKCMLQTSLFQPSLFCDPRITWNISQRFLTLKDDDPNITQMDSNDRDNEARGTAFAAAIDGGEVAAGVLPSTEDPATFGIAPEKPKAKKKGLNLKFWKKKKKLEE